MCALLHLDLKNCNRKGDAKEDVQVSNDCGSSHTILNTCMESL